MNRSLFAVVIPWLVLFVFFVGCGEDEDVAVEEGFSGDVPVSGLLGDIKTMEAVPSAPSAVASGAVTAFHLNRSEYMRQDQWTDSSRVEVDVTDVPFAEIHFSAKVEPPFTDAGATITVTFPHDVADDIALSSNSVQVWANHRWTNLHTSQSGTVLTISVSDLDKLVGNYVTAHTKIRIGNLPPGNHTVALHNSSDGGYTSEYVFKVSAQSAFLLNSNYRGNGTWEE